jgi:hypothetical protein
MTIMNKTILVAVLALVASGCVGFEHKNSVTGPSAAGIGALVGTWTSASIIPSPTSCTDFSWAATEQTTTTAKGTFSAACAGDTKYSGTAEGELNTNGTITWRAQANASGPGMPSCGLALNGSAELMTDGIRIPYSGTTCVGAVSGVEILKKK